MRSQALRALAALTILVTAVAVAADQAPPADAVHDAMAVRLSAALSLRVVTNQFTLLRAVKADGTVAELEPSSYKSAIAEEAGDSRSSCVWSASPTNANGILYDQGFEFVWQDTAHREETRVWLGGPTPTVEVRSTSPRSDDRPYLQALGLCYADERPLLALFQAPLAVRAGERLRQRVCVVVTAGERSLYLAPELGYAPLRYVHEIPARGWVEVYDWWGYQKAGALSLPRFWCFRSFRPKDGALAAFVLLVGRNTAVAAGQASPDLPPAEPRHVPMLPGAVVVRGDRLPGQSSSRLGLSPSELASVVAADGAPWGLSIKALAGDFELRLPGGLE